MFSFTKQKSVVDLYPYIRRICDLTTPNLAAVDTGRSEDRLNRTIPTLLCGWDSDHPATDGMTYCLTSDVADRGVRLVLSQPFRAESLLLGYWLNIDEMPEPWFFTGELRRIQPIGGGFWGLGVELTSMANSTHPDLVSQFKDAARRLLPE